MKASILSIAIVAALGLKAHATDPKFDLTGFTKVQANSGVDVTVVEGHDYRIEAVARRGSLKRLEIDQHGDVLAIDRKAKAGFGAFGNRNRDRFEVTVTLPTLDGVEALSGSTLRATASGDGDFYAHVGQGATLTVTGLTAADIDASARSGSTLRLEGTCEDLDIFARTGSTILADRLICTTVDADSRTGSTLSAYAKTKADGWAGTGATLSVAGNPGTHEFATGTGGVARLN